MSGSSKMPKTKKSQVVEFVNPFDVQIGQIPYLVPVLRKDNQVFAGGKVVLAERLEALVSQDKDKIEAWGNNYFDLADACITFEDSVKLQADSPLLTGIRGVVETNDGLYIAVDAEAVSKATDRKMKYFSVRNAETVMYYLAGQLQSEQAQHVVLLKYNSPSNAILTADQFRAIFAKEIKRADMINGRDMVQNEIVTDKKVIHPAWAIYPAETIVLLVEKTFEYNKRVYQYEDNMGFYLPAEPKEQAEMRALCVYRLVAMSQLHGNLNLGYGYGHLFRVVEKSAAGAPKK